MGTFKRRHYLHGISSMQTKKLSALLMHYTVMIINAEHEIQTDLSTECVLQCPLMKLIILRLGDMGVQETCFIFMLPGNVAITLHLRHKINMHRVNECFS